MRESMKVICVVIFMVAATACVFVWTDDRPSNTVWTLRIACPILSVVAIGLFLMIHFRSDIVPDYLHQFAGTYFNRGGFCFAFNAVPVNDVCCVEAYFQNQYDQPCRGQIALRPARKFFMNRENIDPITFEIACEPAGFGVARAYISLPESVQGKRQTFEVGASVDYLQDKGQQLRFRDGLLLRANSDFGDSFGTALSVAALATGTIVLNRPATVTLELPSEVVEQIQDPMKPEIHTLWRLGDPPLEQVV